MRSRTQRAMLAPMLFLACVAGAAFSLAQDETSPIDVGLEEQVEVRLVLIDFLVLDRKERTVPGLTIDDLILLVDGKQTPIVSLDVDCPIGAADDPRRATKKRPATPIPSDRLRRIVLVFDYDHLNDAAEVYDRIYDLLDTWIVEGYEHMVVSLGEVIRIESPFTTDLDQLHWTLRRMRNDRDLYARETRPLTNERFFNRMLALLDILERWDGRKAVVLFSGPFVPDGFFQDPQFEELAAMAGASRTAIYPIDAAGLRTSLSASAVAGPPVLHRLALETGGRITTGTNDLSIAYARAQRDIGCTYTIAFQDPGRKADNHRRVAIRLRKGLRGNRIYSPDYYVRRSPEEKKKSVQRTATMAPHIFESDRMVVEQFVLEADKTDSWRTLVGVELRAAGSTRRPEPQRWKLEGFLRKLNGTVVRKFEDTLELPATDPATGITPPARLFHELYAPPGEFVLSVVASARGEDDPIAATRLASLAEMPYRGSFVIGPILGRYRGAWTGFQPLLVRQTAPGDPLEAVSVLCVTGPRAPRDAPRLARWISTAEGREVHRYEDVTLQMSSHGSVRCRRVVDEVSTGELAPGRYRIQTLARSEEFTTEVRTTEFVVGAASGAVPGDGPE